MKGIEIVTQLHNTRLFVESNIIHIMPFTFELASFFLGVAYNMVI